MTTRLRTFRPRPVPGATQLRAVVAVACGAWFAGAGAACAPAEGVAATATATATVAPSALTTAKVKSSTTGTTGTTGTAITAITASTASTAPATGAATGAVPVSVPVVEEKVLKEHLSKLLGKDKAKAREARDALVTLGDAALPALREGLARTKPAQPARKRVLDLAILLHTPAALDLLRAAAVKDEDALWTLLLEPRPDDLVWALGRPALARRIPALVKTAAGRDTLTRLIQEYVDAWTACAAAVNGALPAAKGSFAAFLREIESRATTGTTTDWPKSPGPKAPPHTGRGGKPPEPGEVPEGLR